MIINEKLLPKDINTDSGWIHVTDYNEQFTKYSAGTGAWYRKWGKVVQVVGQVKTTESISSGIIFTLPNGFRPNVQSFTIGQGSGVNKWLVNVGVNGDVTAERYGTSSQVNITTSNWLAFSIMFITE